MTHPDSQVDDKSSTGFLFGLSLGAAVGALSAILISKNKETEVIRNFENKVKDFFQDLIYDVKNQKKEPSEKMELVDAEEETKNSPVIKRKITPKMFVKPKR